MSKINCIDISYCQKNINFNAVKADGIEAVIIRAGYGRETSQKDSQFENHYSGAKAAGFKVGAYWYSYADSVDDARSEARACLSILNGRSLDMPIYYDLEDNSQTGLGKSTLTDMAVAFCEEIKAGGYRTGVYANLNWFRNYLDYDYLKSKYSIWLAQYASNNNLDCDIWQNASDGDISGISGNVDTNIIYNNDVFSNNEKISTKDESSLKSDNNDSGNEVSKIQSWLNSNYDTDIVVDGIFGPQTMKALVKALQIELNRQFNAGLVVDGIFGNATRSAVRNIKIGCKGNITQILQAMLICNGYYSNGFDGIFGAGTENAVKQYQRDNGLTVDGIAGKATFSCLCA